MRGIAGILLLLLSCAASPDPSQLETYIQWVAFPSGLNERVLMRWPKRKMPLKVYLPRPAAGLFEDPGAIYDSVRDGVLDWTDVAAPGIPSFVFVDSQGDADIPFAWIPESDGAWYIGLASYEPVSGRLDVSRVAITARYEDGRVADLHDVYAVTLHEMGHALGLGGHSPNREDIMYPAISETATQGLSDRDRATLALLYSRPIGTRIVGAKGR